MVLRWYPADYRATFANEMQGAFEHLAAERRGSGSLATFAIREVAGLVCGAMAEWAAKLTSDRSARGRQLPDPRMMRPPGVTRRDWLRDV